MIEIIVALIGAIGVVMAAYITIAPQRDDDYEDEVVLIPDDYQDDEY